MAVGNKERGFTGSVANQLVASQRGDAADKQRCASATYPATGRPRRGRSAQDNNVLVSNTTAVQLANQQRFTGG